MKMVYYPIEMQEELGIEPERAQFSKLLLENPNYFGTMPTSPLEPVMKMAGNAKYEEITCIGFNPKLDILEATVQVKLPYGYGGGLCTAGTTEYVRFFIDYGDGWENAGLAAFNAHDIPSGKDCAGQPDKPLSYVVTHRIEPRRKHCTVPMLPKVRAILSWEVEPPDDDPDWPMVWGNVLERSIQIRPRWWKVLELLRMGGLKLDMIPAELAAVKDEVIPQPEPEPVPLATLFREVGYEGVEPHRFGFAEMQAVLASAATNPQWIQAKIDEWKELDLDWSAAIEELCAKAGNVAYEELDCLGLEYNLEWLVASFRIKRPSGYCGNLCQKGSQEHIAFWADWDDKCEWTYLGTVRVNVHDIAKIPEDGLHYTALLPVNLDEKRQPCEKPKIARVRAVLSWNTPPSTDNADEIPYWGNRLDAHVQIRPGKPIDPKHPEPIIGFLGGIPISKIGALNGLTTSDAHFAFNGLAPDALGRPCPFGGRVVVQGPCYPGKKYQVQVRKVGDTAWTTVTTKMKLWDLTGTIATSQVPDSAGFFTFKPFHLNVNNLLAWWDTTGDDLWEIKLELQGVVGADVHHIQLDNTGPTVDIHIDSGGDCKDFVKGATIDGHFVARDAYFGEFKLYTTPYAAPAGMLIPASGTTQTALAPGDSWTLDTATMKPCGYVVVVWTKDRAIVNSAWVGHRRSKSVGFCLREATGEVT